MATTKTLAPTNQTITIAGFQGEKPDQRQIADAEGKLADAVNALNSQISDKSKIAYIDINITNDTGIQVNSASGNVITLNNFISGLVIDSNSVTAIFYTYSNLVYVRIKALETMANASAGNYKVRCWYKVN